MPGVRPTGHAHPLMIICTRIWETDQIFAHAENKSADMESAMTFKQGVSGNPHGNRHRTRHLLNQEFMQALLLHFRQHGKKAIEKVARNQPAVYLKITCVAGASRDEARAQRGRQGDDRGADC